MGIHRANGYDLCDQGHCQAFRGAGNEHDGAVQAVIDTHDIVMYYDSEPINAVYFSSSGGNTDDSENVWTQTLPYLRSTVEVVPEYEPRIWSRFFSWNDLSGVLSANSVYIGTPNGAAITRTGVLGRVQELTLYGTGGQIVLTKEEIRTFFSPSSGGSLDSRNFVIGEGFLPALPVNVTNGHETQHGPISGFYGISAGNAVFTMQNASVSDGAATIEYEAANPTPAEAYGGTGVTFSGSGWGHGVGMSQRGAEAMARAGYGFSEILRHYYTGIDIR
jgi:stage II sporulation protein D